MTRTEKLSKLILENEDWLMQRILAHAIDRDYAKYTSTLEEAWRLSIHGLSEAIISLLERTESIPELNPDEDYTLDPMTQFGMQEAKAHRSRGVNLSMFLGLMKYYRQSYVELIDQSKLSTDDKVWAVGYIGRAFDRIELAFSEEWSGLEFIPAIEELRSTNRTQVNEKSKYLTVFESINSPVILLDKDGKIDNMNHVASWLFTASSTPGFIYYNQEGKPDELVWLSDELAEFEARELPEFIFEKELQGGHTKMWFNVKLSRMLDISGKFPGIAVILEDITERKQYEQKLAEMATHDALTGLSNRHVVEDELKSAIARTRRGKKFILLFADIDYFKDINDTFGHTMGDKVLIALAKSLKRCTRTEDMIARIGGDEFVVLLEDADESAAQETVDRILKCFKKAAPKETTGRIGLSVGIVPVSPKATVNTLLKDGDEAMYKSKKRTRA